MLRIAFKVAAAVGVLVFLEKRTKPGTVLISEYNVTNCQCFKHTHMTDGTLKSEKVSRVFCIADGLGSAFAGCPDPLLGGLNPFSDDAE